MASSLVAFASTIAPLVRNRSTTFLPFRKSFKLFSHSSLLLHPPLLLRSRPPLMAATAPDPAASETRTVRVVVKGRVQGVFYRDWTVENATELGLDGWVRNRRDGSVEALFSGRRESVAEMENRCRRGPPAAMVTGFQAFPCSDDPGSGFHRLRTA